MNIVDEGCIYQHLLSISKLRSTLMKTKVDSISPEREVMKKNREFSKSYWKEYSGYHSKKNVFENGKILLLKALNEIGLEFHLFTNPGARKITADILKGTANATVPEPDGIPVQDRLKDVEVDQAIE